MLPISTSVTLVSPLIKPCPSINISNTRHHQNNLFLSQKHCPPPSIPLLLLQLLRTSSKHSPPSDWSTAMVSSRLIIQNTKKLQYIQESAAHPLTHSCNRDHITPILHNLHWLPIPQCILFKLLIITYKALHSLAPPPV